MKPSDDLTRVQSVEEHIVRLNRQVVVDPHRKAQLRDELLRRHQDLTSVQAQRAVRRLWPRFQGLKRLTLVAPPALAITLMAFLILWGLQVSGHRETQQAEAARLSLALARTVPTVTSWQASVQHSRGAAVQSYRCWSPLQNRHLYIRANKLYIYTNQWFQVTRASVMGTGCPAAWQWAFSALQDDRKPPVYPGGRIGTHTTERIAYPATHSKGVTMQVTAWVDHVSGLILRLETEQTKGTEIVAEDRVDYSYGLRGQ